MSQPWRECVDIDMYEQCVFGDGYFFTGIQFTETVSNTPCLTGHYCRHLPWTTPGMNETQGPRPNAIGAVACPVGETADGGYEYELCGLPVCSDYEYCDPDVYAHGLSMSSDGLVVVSTSYQTVRALRDPAVRTIKLAVTVALGVDDFGGVGAMLPAIIARNVTVLGDWTRDIFLLLDVTTTREALEQDPDNSRIMFVLADGVELRLLSTAIWDMMRPSSYRPLSVFGQQSALSHVWLVNSILSFNCAAYGAPPGQDPNDPGIVLLAAVGESIDLSFLALQLGEGQVMLRQQEEYATAFVVGPIQARARRQETFLGFNEVYAMCNPTTRPPDFEPGPQEEDVPPGPSLVRMYMLHLNELYEGGQRVPPDGARALPPPPSEERVDAGVDQESRKVVIGWTIGVAGLVLAMVIASVVWLRSRKPADEPSLAPHAESLGYNNHEMDIYKPVSLTLLLSNQQSLPRALTELMFDQTRARARVCKRSFEHMMHELQQAEAVYAAHTNMPPLDNSQPDISRMDTARSSGRTQRLTQSQRCAQFDALLESIRQLPYLTIHVATAEATAQAQGTEGPMYDTAQTRADERASISDSPFLAADANTLSTVSWTQLDMMRTMDEVVLQMSDPLAAHVTLQSSTTAGSDSTMPNVGMVVQSTRAAYRMVRLVGQGAHGLVYLVQDKDTSQYFCMKLALEASEAATAKVRMESALMSMTTHPHILRHVEYLEHEGRAVLVTELCSLGSLENVLEALRASGSSRGLDEGVVALVLMHMCLALSLLHENEIIHRDIKAANILLTHLLDFKLSDFGVSRYAPKGAQTFTGTPMYMAPEVVLGKEYSFASDLWSLGHVCYELCTQRLLFSASSIKSLQHKYELPYQPIPSTYTAELRHLIMGMLITCPAQRPTAAQLLRSPYLQRALRTSQAIKRKSYAQLSALVSESYLAK